MDDPNIEALAVSSSSDPTKHGREISRPWNSLSGPKPLQRRLVAIFYADVAGYSRLTEEDEEGTHRLLSAYLDTISVAIARHRGKVDSSPASGRGRQRYPAFVRAGIGQAASEGFDLGAQDGRILGDERFVERVRRRQGGATPRRLTLDEVIKAVCRAYRLEEAILRGSGRRRPAEARAMVACLARDLAGVSLTKTATRLSRDISSLSAAATRLEQRAKGDKALAQRHRKLWKTLQ